MDSQLPGSEALDLVESPCTKVCVLGRDQICIGCGRSVEEISNWGQADAQRRREICHSARTRKLAKGDLY
ncbi:MAG: hypothetical protein A3H91_16000 [Gammaproteobacteria bacterium RIFCSPLOWO2_02_FULL_61_13]|nr:MAG: hypothetical protein A3H91_16000 [Gammaproteobacteria bacterium RIFCSPLOWO2_02_FULL_61_13]